jgi:hypothetical protein
MVDAAHLYALRAGCNVADDMVQRYAFTLP